jgi:hypothetical protein
MIYEREGRRFHAGVERLVGECAGLQEEMLRSAVGAQENVEI